MSFKYRNYNVTLENYRDIFNQCSPDVLDEIRSAILDDTQIANFIKECGNDSYKLNQIRLAIREFVPPKYIDTQFTARTMYFIRGAYQKKFNIEPLLKYKKGKFLLLDKTVIEKLAELVFMGVDIDKVDFTKVNANLVDVFCKGLLQNYPMWLCVTDMPVSASYIKILMQGMRLGIDIHPFVMEEWEENQLRVLFSNAERVNISELISMITPKFSDDIIMQLITLMGRNIPIEKLTVTDEEGNPLYNEYQVSVLGRAIENKIEDKSVFNPKLSDVEMSTMIDDILDKRNPNLFVSFSKNPIN